MADKLPILVIVRNYLTDLSYFDDWLDALKRYERFDVDVVDIETRDGIASALRRIADAPFVVCLHSTTGDGVRNLEQLLPALEARQGKLAVFVGNELNLPFAPMSAKLDFLRRSSADLILTQFLQETGDWFYGLTPGAKILSLPHALNGDQFFRGPPQQDRRLDVGARSHKYGVFVGDAERLRLYDYFASNGAKHDLSVDVKMGGERFDRAGWSEFLRSSRATLATEAGSHVVQRDDAICNRIQAHLRGRSKGSAVVQYESAPMRLARRLVPASLKGGVRRILSDWVKLAHQLEDDLSVEDILSIQAEFFGAAPRSPFHTKVISSRHFDAIGTGTIQVMTEGVYNRILERDRHYICLQSDFGNIEGVVERLLDLDYCQNMADETLKYVLEEHTYWHRCVDLESALRSLD
jgi:hypothetical protein